MAKDRETPCLYYICMGECQKCDRYKSRARVRHLNKKKEKLEKIRKNEVY